MGHVSFFPDLEMLGNELCKLLILAFVGKRETDLLRGKKTGRGPDCRGHISIACNKDHCIGLIFKKNFNQFHRYRNVRFLFFVMRVIQVAGPTMNGLVFESPKHRDDVCGLKAFQVKAVPSCHARPIRIHMRRQGRKVIYFFKSCTCPDDRQEGIQQGTQIQPLGRSATQVRRGRLRGMVEVESINEERGAIHPKDGKKKPSRSQPGGGQSSPQTRLGMTTI